MKVEWMDGGYNYRITHVHLKECDVVVARFHDGEGEPFIYRLSVIVAEDGQVAQKMKEVGWRFLEGKRTGIVGIPFLQSIHPYDPDTLRRKLDEAMPDLEHKECEGWASSDPRRYS